jgi:DNA-binding MarR family transcriptional regulator
MKKNRDFGKIIRAITLNTNQYIGSKIEKYGIKQGQFEYFLLINACPGINQLELARLKSVGKASVTKALKILEDEGFVRREIDGNDRRNALCYVTAKGETVADDLLKIKADAERVLFRNFTEQDIESLYKGLSLLLLNSEHLMDDATL